MDLEKQGKRDGGIESRLRVLESVVERAGEPVIITRSAPLDEPGARIVYVNDAFVRQTGYERHEILGSSPRVLLGPDTNAGVRRKMRHALETGSSFQGELLSYRKDGSPFYADISILPVCDRHGEITHWISIQRDVTQRHEREQKRLHEARTEATRMEAGRAHVRLVAIMDALEDAFVSIDDQWRVTFVNRAAERALGLELESPGREDLRSTLREKLEDEAVELVEVARLERRVTEREVCPRDNGRCYLLRASPFEEGASFFLHETTRDYRARETEKRLMTIIEATPDMVSSAELNGRLRYLNRAGYDLLGISPDVPATDIRIADAHPDWAAERVLKEGIPAALANGTWEGETAILRSDGEQVPVSQVIIAHYDEDGKTAYLSTVLRDISAAKRAEEEQRFLAEAGHVLSSTLKPRQVLQDAARLAVQSLADWCMIVFSATNGHRGLVEATYAEPKRRGLTDELARLSSGGKPPSYVAKAMEQPDITVIDPVTAQWQMESIKSASQRRALRRLRPKSMAIAPLVAWGQTLGAVVLASARRGYHYGPRELTLIRELALRVAMTLNNSCLYQRSVRASRARDEVLAVVSHDLRNPLESASLGAMLLRDLLGTGTQAEVGETLERMNRSLERAKRLVSDLLDATRAEAGQLEMSFQEEDPASLAREALDLQREKAADKSVSLKRDLSTVEGRIRADRHRVLQVLTNLLDNAIRHTPSGGSVTLRVRASRLGARFSVIDTGEGIGPADLPHVFDRFWTAGGKKAGGVGLGLPISKAVVEAHGGRIKAESKPGAGATFRFFIPWGGD